MENSNFSVLFTVLLNESGYNLLQFSKKLKEDGTPIAYSTLLSYRSFQVVPTYETAERILQGFGYILSYGDLRALLINSRKQLKEYNRDSKKYIQRGLRLNPRTVKPGLNAAQLEILIEQRIQEVFDGQQEKANFNTYIAYLIKKDLEEIK